MKTSVQRTISLLGSLVLLMAAFLIYSLLIKPEYQIVNELRGVLVGKSNLLSEQQEVISQVEGLLSQYQGSARIQETVSLSLPLREETAGIFSQLQALAQANNLVIEVFGVQNLPTKSAAFTRGATSLVKDLGVLQVSLKLTGVYEDFKDFLRGIETNIRIMDLVNLKIERSGRGSNVFTYNIILNTYYQTN